MFVCWSALRWIVSRSSVSVLAGDKCVQKDSVGQMMMRECVCICASPYVCVRLRIVCIQVEPSGLTYNYFGCAIGKGKQAAKVEIEKLKLGEMTCKDVLKEVARIIYSVHDDVKDKDFELELSWVCEESGWVHKMVPKDLLKAAEASAKAALEEDMEDD